MATTTPGDDLGTVGLRWWDGAIKTLVPVALIAAMIAHAFPFVVPSPDFDPINPESGLALFVDGFRALTVAPLDPFFEAFSLPLTAAFVGLIYQSRPGWIGSLVPLICAVVGLTCLGSAYFWVNGQPLAYGYFAAEASFLIAALASVVRLIRLHRNRAMWYAKAQARYEPAASASQELLARYRKEW